MKKLRVFRNLCLIVFTVFLLLFSCKKENGNLNIEKKRSQVKHKVLYVDSYYTDLAWVRGITNGILTTFDITVDESGKLNNEISNIDLKIVHMDTKRNQSEEFMKEAALKVKSIIEEWEPEVVITSDDNAAKYLIVPYYKNSVIPFVFCGVNWDVSDYGFPADNITGMIEVQLIPQLVEHLTGYLGGKKVGYLKGDSLSSRKEVENFEKALGYSITKRFASNYKEWETYFKEIQKEVDVLLLANLGAIGDWDKDEEKLKEFMIDNTIIPTGTWDTPIAESTLITLATIPEEQGEWAAKQTLEILNGKSPVDIPLVKNKKAKVYLNMPISKKLGIKFSQELIDHSHIVGIPKKKVLYVDSYNKGLGWSDGIEEGILKAFNIEVDFGDEFDISKSEVELKIFRMNTKVNKSDEEIKSAALQAKDIIDTWKPDIVITSDDNAVKFLVVPYYKDSDLPFVFCGVNWDASDYGLPTKNITGMLEVSLILDMISDLKKYTKGNRIGVLASDMLSQRKASEMIQQILGVHFSEEVYVSTFEDWKKSYIEMQNSVDILIIKSYAGISDFNLEEAKEYVLENSIIPSFATQGDFAPLSLICYSKVPEEQGEWAGSTALRILSGKSPADIPVVTNKLSKKVINIRLANKMGLELDQDILENSTISE